MYPHKSKNKGTLQNLSCKERWAKIRRKEKQLPGINKRKKPCHFLFLANFTIQWKTKIFCRLFIDYNTQSFLHEYYWNSLLINFKHLLSELFVTFQKSFTDTTSSSKTRLWCFKGKITKIGWGWRHNDKGRIHENEARTWSVSSTTFRHVMRHLSRLHN